ncbi:MAG: ABC transporter permease subunit [Lachnospiraceae bacterium]|nr:ABC transporter permease subunit [Lachnospiraceae bacterium]
MKIKNAVLWKEMAIDMKKARYIVLITTLVALLSFAAAGFVAIVGIASINFSTIPYKTGSVYLTVCIICEAAILALIIPIFCAGSITAEREKQTMEVLLTTKMSTWEIVKGKFLAPILLAALIILCILPILSVGYLYGGLPLWQLLVYTLLLIFWIMYICTFCMYCSAISTRTIFSLVLSFVIMMLILGLSIILVIGACLIIAVVNELGMDFLRTYYPNIYSAVNGFKLPVTPPIFLLYLNPLVSFYELLVRMFGFGFDGESYTMAAIISEVSGGTLTENFIFSRFWLEISIVLQALVGFIVLKASARVMNPLRNAKKRMQRNEKRIAEIEAAREEKRRLAINNGTYQAQMEQVWGTEGAMAADWKSDGEAAAEAAGADYESMIAGAAGAAGFAGAAAQPQAPDPFAGAQPQMQAQNPYAGVQPQAQQVQPQMQAQPQPQMQAQNPYTNVQPQAPDPFAGAQPQAQQVQPQAQPQPQAPDPFAGAQPQAQQVQPQMQAQPQPQMQAQNPYTNVQPQAPDPFAGTQPQAQVQPQMQVPPQAAQPQVTQPQAAQPQAEPEIRGLKEPWIQPASQDDAPYPFASPKKEEETGTSESEEPYHYPFGNPGGNGNDPQ